MSQPGRFDLIRREIKAEIRFHLFDEVAKVCYVRVVRCGRALVSAGPREWEDKRKGVLPFKEQTNVGSEEIGI